MVEQVNELQIEGLLTKLKELRQELYAEVETLKKTASPVLLDQQAVGRVSRIDALQQQQVAHANLGQCQERINQIELALHKIDNEDYGYCEDCGNPIAAARLELHPESSLCINCQQQQENRENN